jgi:hypothetical protein
MPIKRSDYPPDWESLANQVKTEAGWRCEWCGAAHGQVGKRLKSGALWIHTSVTEYDGFGQPVTVDASTLSWKRLKYHGLTRIVITTAHLDRNTHNNHRDNLAALCQRCHLRHDILQHIANRRYGRRHAKEHQLKLEI